ncbi:MAG: hypothetical protein HY675_13885 [Chloroflexi bacterium]|nr:hypothetical protein [Chloroflexota bacterium]
MYGKRILFAIVSLAVVLSTLAVAGGGILAVVAEAAPGDLDTSFGGDGIVSTTSLRNLVGSVQGNSVAVQSDGKIVMAGAAQGPFDGNDFGLLRYNPDGTLDATFSREVVTTDIGGASADEARDVLIQPDGKIVSAGRTQFPGQRNDFALTRHLGIGGFDRSLDITFGLNGRVTTDFGGDDVANAVARQSDGKIVAAGGSRLRDQNVFRIALARYNLNGTLDPTFGIGGKVVLVFASGASQQATDVAIQPDGKIVVAVSFQSFQGLGFIFAVARFQSDGSLDLGFGQQGLARIVTFGNVVATALALLPDGRIMVVGRNFLMTGPVDFVVARFFANGTLDDVVVTDFDGRRDGANAVVVLPGGPQGTKIVVAGLSAAPAGLFDAAGSEFALARYNVSGVLGLDATFGVGGKLRTRFSGAGIAQQRSIANGLALQPLDGTIVAVGTTRNSSGATQTHLLAARYLP